MRAEAAPPTAISLLSFDGTEIWYDLYDRPGDALVLVLPGFWRTRRHESMASIATRLASRGYSVAVVDLRGHGDSGGRFGFNRDEYRDVEAVLEDLERRKGKLRLALMGLSLGGAVAVTLAARTDFEISCIVLISPVADFDRIRPKIRPLEMPQHIAWGQALRWPKFDWRFFRTPKLVAAEEIGEVDAPTCLIHVVDDWLIDHEHSETLHSSHHGESELHLIDLPCGYHADRIFSIAPGKLESIIEPYLQSHLPLTAG